MKEIKAKKKLLITLKISQTEIFIELLIIAREWWTILNEFVVIRWCVRVSKSKRNFASILSQKRFCATVNHSENCSRDFPLNSIAISVVTNPPPRRSPSVNFLLVEEEFLSESLYRTSCFGLHHLISVCFHFNLIATITRTHPTEHLMTKWDYIR